MMLGILFIVSGIFLVFALIFPSLQFFPRWHRIALAVGAVGLFATGLEEVMGIPMPRVHAVPLNGLSEIGMSLMCFVFIANRVWKKTMKRE